MNAFKVLFTNMDRYKVVILLFVAAIIGLATFMGTQWKERNRLRGFAEEDRFVVDVEMMRDHERLRENVGLLRADQFAGYAAGDLNSYVRNALRNVGVLPDVTSRTQHSGQKWGQKKGQIANEINFEFLEGDVKSRTVHGIEHGQEIKGGFSLQEIQKLLYQIEKNSGSVRVKALQIRPYSTDPTRRTGRIDDSETNENWRWKLEKLTVMSLTSEPSGT